jgi:integrase
VTVTLALPRYVIAKPLASGAVGFYFTVPTRYRKLGCSIPNEPLGTDYADACGADGKGGRAAALNGRFDEWWRVKNGEPIESTVQCGTVDWLFREYKASKHYREKVSARTQPDYERLMKLVLDHQTKRGDLVGKRLVKSISPLAADKIYEQLCVGPNGPRPRQGEKVVALCRAAWGVVHRLHPKWFDRNVPNPWVGVTLAQRQKAPKPAVTREEVYRFAWGAIEAGRPEPAAAAVICFEFLQRPENVLAGYLAWPNYRGREAPGAIKVNHHKTGAVVWHPLEETTQDGLVKFYADAEAVLATLPRRGIAMILKQRHDGTTEPYTVMQMGKLVRKLRDRLGLPSTFTLDACRHGGMTELEEAELTDGQGRALSGHRTQRAYEGYAKRTLARALPATRKRYAHTLGNIQGTSIQNAPDSGVQNDREGENAAIA